MPSTDIEQAARNVVQNYLRLQPGQRFVIIADETTQMSVAVPIATQAMLLGAECRIVNLDKWRRPKHPSKEDPALALPPEIKRVLGRVDAAMYAADVIEGELYPLRVPVINVINALELMYAHSPHLSAEIMASALLTPPKEIIKLTAGVGALLEQASKVVVTTQAGTNIEIEFDPNDPDSKVARDDGNFKPGVWGNLPAGEAFFAPTNGNGTVVADGFIGDHWNRQLDPDKPITFEIEDGRAISVHGQDTTLVEALTAYLFDSGIENSERLGEFGVGTNPSAKPAHSLLEAEKAAGTVHFAFGNPLGDHTGATWKCEQHCDFVILEPTVIIHTPKGEIKLLKDGELNLGLITAAA